MADARTLEFFLASSDAPAGRAAARAFSSGLQDLLSAMAGVYSAGIAKSMGVPPGFTGRFAKAFERPTLGGLREFVLWLAVQETGASVRELSEYLTKHERKPSGWISTLVQLRNLWAHPRDETPEEIERKAEALLMDPPDLASLGRIEIGEGGRLAWVGAGGSHALGPFLWAEGDKLRVFTGFAPPERLLSGDADAPTQPAFAELWRELRLRDPSLDDPTAEEFHARARLSAGRCEGEAPWWLDRVFGKGPAGMLVEPGLADGVLAGLEGARRGATGIDLTPSSGQAPLEAVASKLGLARAPSREEFIGFAAAGRPLCVFVRARDLDSRALLQLLYWLADLHAPGAPEHLRVLIERGRDELARDQEALWDRLPDGLRDILRAPPRTAASALPEYLWTRRRKRFLGVF